MDGMGDSSSGVSKWFPIFFSEDFLFGSTIKRGSKAKFSTVYAAKFQLTTRQKLVQRPLKHSNVQL